MKFFGFSWKTTCPEGRRGNYCDEKGQIENYYLTAVATNTNTTITITTITITTIATTPITTAILITYNNAKVVFYIFGRAIKQRH